MFEDIFGPLDDITKKPEPVRPPEPEGWDTGQTPTNGNDAWDSGQRENIWRTGQQFWDTGNRNVTAPPLPDPSQDPDYDPDDDFLIEDDDDDPDQRW